MAGALDNGLFLRLPGQWDDGTWAGATSGAGIYYNVARWLETGTARFTRPDPIRWRGSKANTYSYGENQPLLFVNRLGLAAVQNNSGMPISYKPEHEETIKLCSPGQSCDVDGVYPPSCGDFPIKIVDGCTGKVGTNGKLVIWCPFFEPAAPELREKFPAAGQLATGGAYERAIPQGPSGLAYPEREALLWLRGVPPAKFPSPEMGGDENAPPDVSLGLSRCRGDARRPPRTSV